MRLLDADALAQTIITESAVVGDEDGWSLLISQLMGTVTPTCLTCGKRRDLAWPSCLADVAVNGKHPGLDFMCDLWIPGGKPMVPAYLEPPKGVVDV